MDGERTFHGVTVPDPQRWLADVTTPEARKWLDAQDDAATEMLKQCEQLAPAREFLERNHVAPHPVWHARRGERLFMLVRRPGLPQPLLCVREAGAERVLLDPNPGGLSIHQDQVSVSPSGRFVALLIAPAGEVLGTVRVIDGVSGERLEESDCKTVMPIVAWHPDEQGFYYSLCRKLFEEAEDRRDGLYWHPRGAPWPADRCIRPYHEGPGHIAYAYVAPECGWLILSTRQFSNSKSGWSLCRLPEDPANAAHASVMLFEDLEGYGEYLGETHGELYFHTCVDAPNGCIVAIDPHRPQRSQWRTVVPESERALARPERFGGPLKTAVSARGLLYTLVEHAHDTLRYVELSSGGALGLEPPVLSTVDGVFAIADGFRIYTQSFLVPRAVYDYRPGEHGLTEVERAAMPGVNLDDYELRQEFVPVSDGARVPLYLLHARGQARDGRTPALLYGYGGFGQSITPEYHPEIALWLSLGGLYALANIRGGGEYGEHWHRSGTGLRKQRGFDDFYAAAEHLIAGGYTSAANLVARGISNGGLLTAVCAHQRPELFAAVVCEVPLVDVMGLDDTPTGTAVAAEYGSAAASRALFDVIRSYSPLQNVRRGLRTPPTFVVIAEQDGSAPAGQACRYVAERQAAIAESREYAPVLLRVVRGEGHTGWPPEKTRGALAEEVAFLHHFASAGAAARLEHRLDLRVPMRDGVTLSANVWLPEGGGRHAAVLLRTPYMNDAVQFERMGLRTYVEAGYAVVFQLVRGRGTSGGTFGFFFQEGRDGYDSIEWVAAQEWCNGRVATDGGSYLGTAQWLAAREKPPHLVCMMPAVPAGDWFNEIPYVGGALQVDWAFSWLGGMAGIEFDFEARGERNLENYRPLAQAEGKLGVELPLYRDILAHDTLDDWWRPLQLSAEDHARMDVPLLTVTGWFDGDQAGTLRYWQDLEQHARTPARARLIIGPWLHAECYLGGTGRVQELDFGPASVLPIKRLRLEFLDAYLRGAVLPPAPRVRVFVGGSNRWLGLDNYPPPAEPQRWFLKSGGGANTERGDGRLGTDEARGAADRFVYDPADPVPYKPGAANHRELEQRMDVLVYTSDALARPMTVVGLVEAVLYCASSAPDTDFTAKLLDVDPDGRALSLTHVGGVLRARCRNGYERHELLQPGRVEEFRIRLSHVGHTFLPGHRIRLEVSSSNFPLADPNPNTGADIATETACVKAHQTVHHDAERPSHLLLPVLKED